VTFPDSVGRSRHVPWSAPVHVGDEHASMREPMRRMLVLLAAVIALTACAGPSPAPTQSNFVSTLPPAVEPHRASPAVVTATEPAVEIARCERHGAAAFSGVLDTRPPGWSLIGEIAAIPEFPNTFGGVYGPPGAAVPPNEGPRRIVLYETMPGTDAYFKSRIERSRKRHGKPIAVSVCGEPTSVWLEATGELVVGWVDRDKSDVLVANAADLTIQELVDAAEGVSDCCG
jgi:hypothetical protein